MRGYYDREKIINLGCHLTRRSFITKFVHPVGGGGVNGVSLFYLATSFTIFPSNNNKSIIIYYRLLKLLNFMKLKSTIRAL